MRRAFLYAVVRSLFLSLFLALGVSAADFQFDATGVTATVTPHATTYWACACTGSSGAIPLYANRQAIIEDSDGDGVVRWEQGIRMLGGLYTMIDASSGSITTRRSYDGAAVAPLAFPAKAFLRDENESYSRFVMNGHDDMPGSDLLWIFWARPGVGAWHGAVVDNGGFDEVSTWFEIMFDVRRMEPVSESPSVPQGVQPGDFLVVHDYHAGFWVGSLVDSHLSEATGGGVVLHAKTTGHEDDKKMTVTLARIDGTDGAVSVHYETTDDTAKAGVHYQAAAGSAVFPPGHIFSTFEVPVIDDSTDAGGVRFNVTLSEPSGATIGSPTISVAVADNDDQPVVLPDRLSIPEGDGGPQDFPYKVSLNHTAPKPVTLQWEVRDHFTNATLQNGTLDFAVGEKEKTIPIHYVADDAYSQLQWRKVVITSAVNALFGREGQFRTVEDDPPPTFTVSNATVSESAGSATVTVQLSEPLTFDYSVVFITEDGTATSPADFAGTSWEMTQPFNAGSSTVTITIPIHDDAVGEGTETFRVSVYVFEDDGLVSGTVTILDDDGTTPPRRRTVRH